MAHRAASIRSNCLQLTRCKRTMFFESFLLNFSVLGVLIVALTFDYVSKYFSYWYVRHISYKTTVPFFGSDYHRVLGLRNTTDEVNKLYAKHPDERLYGCIKSRIPDLIVKDPDVIEKMLCTDFASFHCKGLGLDKSQDVCLRNNLFYAEGEKWTVMREGMESLLKSMPYEIEDSLHGYLSGINGDTNVQQFLADILDGTFEYLLLNKDFTRNEKKIIQSFRSAVQKPTLAEKFKTYLKNVFPSLYLLFGLSTLPGETVNKSLEVLEKSNLMKEVKRIRSEFQLDIKEKHSKRKRDSDIELAVSILASFITEGYIPCLNVLTALFYELAKYPEVQKKIRLCGSGEDCEVYLDKVINETLRLHPAYSITSRKCTKMYKFPDGLVIDRGLTATIPIEALHQDRRFYEKPEIFNPDRFDEGKLKHAYSYIPFGAGPRKCVGEELSKRIISSISRRILLKYQVRPCSKTPPRLPKTDLGFARVIDRDIWLNFTPID
ncbi:cytochrome P450 6B1-like [Cydia pomonella]|uniref:cytochrome P450 6B1-like n=1 Tax=Cydia pomonella TaxID=82600 RepID=UPI002ADE59D3|nr:cytochrome P450 6B1-like [Cydia pomonella]